MADVVILEEDTLATFLRDENGYTLIRYGSANALGGGAAAVNVDNDPTLSSDSTVDAPTVHAVRGYVATAVTGLLDYKGTIDCSANPNYPAASKGDTYKVSVAGKIGGASGVDVDLGDWVVANADNVGGSQAAVGANWDTLEHNGAFGGGYTDEQAQDAIAIIIAAATHQGIAITYDDAAGTLAFKKLETWPCNFTAAGDLYIFAEQAMTIDSAGAAIGTGTLAYAKSTTASPGTFSSTTLPATLQAGAWLKVTASAVTGFVAKPLKQTA